MIDIGLNQPMQFIGGPLDGDWRTIGVGQELSGEFRTILDLSGVSVVFAVRPGVEGCMGASRARLVSRGADLVFRGICDTEAVYRVTPGGRWELRR